MKKLFCMFLLAQALWLPAWAEETVYIDVRSESEYASGHIANALLMPHDQISKLINEAKLSKDTPITLYCRSGRRADAAQKKLQELGYTNVTNAGGYEELASALNQECSAATC